jgi:ABC-type Fe3+ transport system permease subunit
MEEIVDTLVPISVCVVLPVAIVLINALVRVHGENKRTQLMLKAIEANKDVDINKLIESFKKPQKTADQILNKRLLYGCVFTLLAVAVAIAGIVMGDSWMLVSCGAFLAVGVSFLIVYFVTRKQVK